MTKYRKKPVTVEAVQWTENNLAQILAFTQGVANYEIKDNELSIIIHTLEGDMRASKGDYIIRGVDGEYYPCKESIFLQTYEPAEK